MKWNGWETYHNRAHSGLHAINQRRVVRHAAQNKVITKWSPLKRDRLRQRMALIGERFRKESLLPTGRYSGQGVLKSTPNFTVDCPDCYYNFCRSTRVFISHFNSNFREVYVLFKHRDSRHSIQLYSSEEPVQWKGALTWLLPRVPHVLLNRSQHQQIRPRWRSLTIHLDSRLIYSLSMPNVHNKDRPLYRTLSVPGEYTVI